MTVEVSLFPGVFEARDTDALKKAFDATCGRLKIPIDDMEARCLVSQKLLHLANMGRRDFETLSTAIQSLNHPRLFSSVKVS